MSALVELFEGDACQGTPVPKSAETLSISVRVDTAHVVRDKADDLLSVLWDKFLNFWGAFVALLFAVLLFVIRRKLTAKTGFKEKENED